MESSSLQTCLLSVTSKESIQRRHYFLLEQLQYMITTIDKEYQARFSSELLTALSSSLIDGTVFEIVRGLFDLQSFIEKNLYNERLKLVNDYSTQRDVLLKRHKDTEQSCETRLHHLPIVQAANKRELNAFDKRMNDELKRLDLKILNELDQKVIEQQDTMKKAGVPGFHITKEPFEVKMQMYIFEFVQRLSEMQMPN